MAIGKRGTLEFETSRDQAGEAGGGFLKALMLEEPKREVLMDKSVALNPFVTKARGFKNEPTHCVETNKRKMGESFSAVEFPATRNFACKGTPFLT